MDESYLTRSTYAAFIELLDNYNPYIGQEEEECSKCEAEIEQFIDEVMKTQVMLRTWQFMVEKGT